MTTGEYERELGRVPQVLAEMKENRERNQMRMKGKREDVEPKTFAN